MLIDFPQKALGHIHPGYSVLELGAGRKGWFARESLARQAIVTAVDLNPPNELHPEIEWYTGDVRDFIERLPKTGMFNVIYSRNLIQFLEATWVQEKLFPALIQHIQPNGIVAIETFFDHPDPPFAHPLASLYHLADLMPRFPGWTPVLQEERTYDGPDMRGDQRHFSITNLIIQKTKQQ